MSFADTRIAISQKFATGWAASAHASVHVVYPNTVHDPETDAPYLRLTLLGGPSRQADIAGDSATTRFFGVVQVEAAVAEETGSQAAFQLLDTATALLRRGAASYGSSGAITFRTPTTPTPRQAFGRFVLTTRIPFHRDVQDAAAAA